MNEEYLKGYFNSYVKPQKADADYNDWVSKIANNSEYKQNMFNSYVKPQKPNADYNDWETKVFGTPQQVEQKKNQPVPQPQTTKPTQTNNMGGSQTPSPSYDFNSYFGSVVDALPEEKKSLLFRPKQAAAVEAYKNVPEATKEKMQPIIAKSTEYKDYELRQDGKTPKGTGWFGVQKTPDGKDMTEYTISFTVDGKDIEVPTLNPYLTSDEVKKLVETGEVTDEIEKKTLQWYKDRTAEGKDVFISENDNQIDISEGYKNTALIDAIPIDDIKAATGQPNPYKLVSQQAVDYENKVAASEQSKEEIENWIIQTTNPSTLESYTINDYFEWQRQYQKEMEENMPYYMNDFYDYAAKMKAEHPEWSDDELNKSLDDYWNMFTVKNFQNIEGAAWEKFSESQKTSMRDASIPEKLDYIFSSVTSNTIIGNFSAYSKAIIDASIDAVEGGEGNVGEFYRENMGFVKENRSKYKDLSTVQEITETAILLSADMPVFNILGAGASAVTNYGWRAASEVATIMGVPANVAKIAAIQSGLNIAKAGVNTGVLLGSYDTLLAIGDKLSTTKVSELDSNDYKDFVNSFNKGAVAGMAVGVFSGITHSLLQKMNSNAIKKLYPTVDGKVAIAATGKTPRLKLLNTGIHIGAGILEGGLIFPLSHAAIDYAKGDEEAFQNITVQSVIEDGLKFAIAIKAQQLPSIIEQVKSSNYMIDPNFRKPFENGFTYSKAELKRWGVKDIAELQIKLNDANWLTEIQKSGQVTMVDFLKVMYDSQGIMFNNKMSINESVAQTVDKKPVLVSYDKEGRVIDIAEYKTMTEAKRAEYLINEVNITDKIVSKSADLDSKAVIELNAEYEKSPEKLVAINEALLKAPSQRTASESQLLLEVNQKIDKQIKRIETERKSKEVKPKTEKEVGKENEIKPLEQTLTLNDKEYTVREENGKNEVYVKNEQGLLTRENNTETIDKVLDLSFTKEVAKDVTLLNTQQKEKELRQQKEEAGEIELNDLVEKKTKELMKDIEADYDGQVTVGGIDVVIKKQFGKGRKLDIFVKNFKGDYIHIEDMEGITPFSKKQMERIKNVALRKFLSENATIVDMTYEQIAQYRQEQKAIIDKRIDAEIKQEISEYQRQRDKLYTDKKLSTENVEIPKNIEKHKSNFLGKLKTSKDIDVALAEVRKEKWFKELNGDTQDVVHAMFRDFGEKQLGTVGKEAKMTPAEKSPASQTEFTIKFGQYLKDLETISKKSERITKTNVKKGLETFEKDITTFLKDNRETARLTDREYNSLIKRISKTIKETTLKDGTISTPEMKRQAVMEYIKERLIASSERRIKKETMENADKVKKLTQSDKMYFGDKTLEIQKELDFDFSNLPAEQMTVLNENLKGLLSEKTRPTPENIEKFLTEMRDVVWTPKERKAKDNGTISNLVAEVFESQIKDISDYKATKSKLRKLANLAEQRRSEQLNKLSEKDFDKYEKEKERIEKEYLDTIDLIESKSGEIGLKDILEIEGQNLKSEFMAETKDVSDTFLKKLREGKDTGFNFEQNREIEAMFQTLRKDKVVEKLTPEDAELLNYVSENIDNGFMNGHTTKIMRKIADINYAVSDKTFFDKIKNTRRVKNLKKLQKKNQLQGQIDSINGYRTNQFFGVLGNEGNNAIFAPTVRNYAKAKEFVESKGKEVNDTFIDLNKSLKGFLKGSSKNYRNTVAKLAIIRAERAWQSNRQRDLIQGGKVYEVGDKAKPEYMNNYFDSAFKRVNEQQVRDKEDYRRTRDVWDSIKADKTNFNADGSLNVEKMYNELSPAEKKVFDAIDKFNKDIEQYVKWAAMQEGRTHIPLNNYDFYHVLNETGRLKFEAETFIDAIMQEAKNPSFKVGSTYERDMGASMIRTDIDNVIKKQLEELGSNLFIKPDLYSNLRGLEMVKKEMKEYELDAIIDAFKETIPKRLVRGMGKESMDSSRELVNNIYGYMSKAYLGNPVRIINELSGNTVRNIMTEFAAPKKVDDAYREMLTEMVADSRDYSQLANDIGKSERKGEKAIENIVAFSDKVVSPAIFEKGFNRSFKEQTGQDFDVEKYKTDAEYRQKYYNEIVEAKADGLVRVEELYNSKSGIAAATHITLLGKSLDKKSGVGKSLYFLQSFSHNEALQMQRATQMVVEGVKTNNKNLIGRGIRDIVALPVSNIIYMQMGIALTSMGKAYWKQVVDDENFNPLPAFEKGLYDYWQNSLANGENLTRTITSSLINLSAGKYNTLVKPVLGLFLGYLDKDKSISQSQKDAIKIELRDGLFIKPVDFSSSGYGAYRDLAGMFPIFGEMVNAADVLLAVPEISKDISEGDFKDGSLEALFLINSLFRYKYVNPYSNMIDKWIKNYKKAEKYSDKDSEIEDTDTTTNTRGESDRSRSSKSRAIEPRN